MKKIILIIFIVVSAFSINPDFNTSTTYIKLYDNYLADFINEQNSLIKTINTANISSEKDLNDILKQVHLARLKLKENDFWLRYLQPTLYLKINGPLPVEWETEVFEKFERPYKRIGAGLSLAELYLDKKEPNKDSLISLIQSSIEASKAFEADSITTNLNTYHHFFLANRLFLLNLSSIYTTGFECPDTTNIIPELRFMLTAVMNIYNSYNESFPTTALTKEYLDLYNNTISFTDTQPTDFSKFDHYTFIKDYVNVLFKRNQQFIKEYSVVSDNYNDYTLNNDCLSIFDKTLYNAQNIKGIYAFIKDENVLNQIKQTGKLLFYDPILSGNNKRSCASCHKPDEYFTDTTVRTNLEYDGQTHLPRNTTSLINATFNHLLMMDGRQTTLLNQASEVMMSDVEMHNTIQQMIEKVLSCKEYKDAFKKYLKFTPEEKEVTVNHIISAISLYYGGFSNYYSPFDDAINKHAFLDEESIKGFNLFMSKAQCATCHFVPQFNGVKPPFINSEFEVLGVPEDTAFKKLSIDSGRYSSNPAAETLNAFRTGSIRNAPHTKPYMHNGVFKTLDEVVDFYDAGGGEGKKLVVKNQTLSPDSLHLSKTEKEQLIAFINSLNEKIIFDQPPQKLPVSSNKNLNNRKIGGEY